VDRDVVDRREHLLELLARRTMRIGEDHQRSLAVAALHLHSEVVRQRIHIDRRELAHPLLGEVAIRLGIDDPPDDDVRRVRIRVDDLHAVRAAKAHLVDAGQRRGGNAFDLRAAKLGFDRLANRRFVRGGSGECAAEQHHDKNSVHRFL